MFKLKRKGQIIVEASKQIVVDRLHKSIDTNYYSENQHKWPTNNIEINPSGKLFYGIITDSEFYISGKKKLFRKEFNDIEIRGEVSINQNSTVVDYTINSKPQNMIILMIINMILILMLLFIPYALGLESEKIKGYMGIPILLVFLNFLIPFGLRRKLKQGELKLKEIITTP